MSEEILPETKEEGGFEILFGGSPPEVETPAAQNQENNQGISVVNWENCIFKHGPTTYFRQGCCGTPGQTVTSFVCQKLSIGDLSPSVCEKCQFCEISEK